MQGFLAGVRGQFPADFNEPGPELFRFPPAGFHTGKGDHLGPGHHRRPEP